MQVLILLLAPFRKITKNLAIGIKMLISLALIAKAKAPESFTRDPWREASLLLAQQKLRIHQWPEKKQVIHYSTLLI